eukprot:7911575-Heterocapsa_arctica.AAC.1
MRSSKGLDQGRSRAARGGSRNSQRKGGGASTRHHTFARGRAGRRGLVRAQSCVQLHTFAEIAPCQAGSFAEM